MKRTSKRKAQAEQEAKTAEKGHGRREHRRLLSAAPLAGSLGWPGAASQAPAALGNAAVYLLGQVNPNDKAAAPRHLAAHPRNALALLRS